MGPKSMTYNSLGGMSEQVDEVDEEDEDENDDDDMEAATGQERQEGHDDDDADGDDGGDGRRRANVHLEGEDDDHHRHDDHGEDDRHQDENDYGEHDIGINGGGGGRGERGLAAGDAAAAGGRGAGTHGRSGQGGGYGERYAQDQNDLEARRAMAHAYADDLDGISREAPLYPVGAGVGGLGGGGGEGGGGAAGGDGGGASGARGGVPSSAPESRQQQMLAQQQREGSSGSLVMPPPPPGATTVSNGTAIVDVRSTAALAERTRLTPGATAAGPSQAAAEEAAALRRGPTPGSHSLPSMVLVPLEALKAHRRVPRSSDRRFVFFSGVFMFLLSFAKVGRLAGKLAYMWLLVQGGLKLSCIADVAAQ